MLRIFLLNILMFSLPFVLYGGYMYLVGRHQPGRSIWRTAPVLWLLIAGLVLIMVTVGSLVSFTGSKPGGVYYPPKLENGKIIPGHIEHGRSIRAHD